MTGHLYRYPHPFDCTKFLYVGQGSKRDKRHRNGKEMGFGKSFKRDFPGVELPQPIRECIEVPDQLTLNEEETIRIFQYHTWYAEGGYNKTLPGGQNYKAAGDVGGPIAGMKNVKTGHIQRLGIIYGKKNAESGHIQALGRKIGNIYGPIMGKIRAASGDLQKMAQAAGLKGGKIGAPIVNHNRWHVDRNKPNPRCALCAEQNMIVAWG